ncbi:MAG: FapA family protein [Clostridia bacterium]|nr:FapA family protein [Clostridia bacterium]MDD4047600.1 FapA family protein [Clostridia bacterium]
MMEKLKKKYKLQKFDDGIYITVEEDCEYPFIISIDKLYNELARRKINYDTAIIKKIFTDATGKCLKIADIEEEIIYEPIIDIGVSTDNMKVILKMYPALNGTVVRISEVEELIAKNKIECNIKKELFLDITKKHYFYKEWIIAEGRTSINGENAKLEFSFNIEGMDTKPKELEDGSVNFHELNLINIVQSGTVLVKKTPATDGISGMNVYGQEIKPNKGKDLRLPMGLNTQMIDDNKKLISTKEGHVAYINNKVNVFPTYEVKGDVDFNTGNIKFPGNVIVRGNVITSFYVEAGGDVQIYGNLLGHVKINGNLQVKKGIVCGNADVKGNIFVRQIENASVASKQNITVSEAIMHSNVRADEKLIVNGKKGLIVGGCTFVGKKITAKIIGSPVGTRTIIEVGVSRQLKEEYKCICKELKENEIQYRNNVKAMEHLLVMKDKQKALTAEKNELLVSTRRMQYELKKRKINLENRKNDLEEYFKKAKSADVEVLNTIYSGVVINIGNSTHDIIEEKSRIKYYYDGYEIKEGSL